MMIVNMPIYSFMTIRLVFLQGKRIGKKKKTSVKSCNLNPYWNESFVFLIDEMDMKRVYIDVTVNIFLNINSHIESLYDKITNYDRRHILFFFPGL